MWAETTASVRSGSTAKHSARLFSSATRKVAANFLHVHVRLGVFTGLPLFSCTSPVSVAKKVASLNSINFNDCEFFLSLSSAPAHAPATGSRPRIRSDVIDGSARPAVTPRSKSDQNSRSSLNVSVSSRSISPIPDAEVEEEATPVFALEISSLPEHVSPQNLRFMLESSDAGGNKVENCKIDRVTQKAFVTFRNPTGN